MNEGGRNGERMGYIEREGLMDAWEGMEGGKEGGVQTAQCGESYIEGDVLW